VEIVNIISSGLQLKHVNARVPTVSLKSVYAPVCMKYKYFKFWELISF